MAGRRTVPLSTALAEAQAGPLATPAGGLARRQPSPIDAALSSAKPSIRRALPDGFPGGEERFARLVLTAVRMVPALNRCTPISVIGAAMQAAQLGLEPGVLGQAWILPYRNRDTGLEEASFQLGWKGIVTLAARGGFTLSGATVHHGDQFEYELGLEPKLRHVPAFEGRGDSYLWWAVATSTETGRPVGFAVLDRSMVEKRRAASKSPNSPAWRQWYDEMALGKAARECARMLPLSTEMAAAVASDGTVRVELEGTPEDYPTDDGALEVESEEVQPVAQ